MVIQGGWVFLMSEVPLKWQGIFEHVAIGGLVGLALKVHLTQARGTLSMGPQVYARRA